MKERKLGNPVTYQKYLDVAEQKKKDIIVKRKKSELNMLKKEIKRDLHKTKFFIQLTESQVIQFINTVYAVYAVKNFKNPEVYQKKSTGTSEIFQLVKEDSTALNNKTPLAFSRWCSKNRLNAVESRNNGVRKRNLFIMDEIYHDCLLTSITEYLPNYQQPFKALQNNE